MVPTTIAQAELAATAKCLTKGTAGAIAKSAAIKGPIAGKGVAVGTAATGGKSAVAASASKTVAAGGTIWMGPGFSLGLGVGLGAWGPILLAGAVAAVGVGIYGYLKNQRTMGGELEEAIG